MSKDEILKIQQRARLTVEALTIEKDEEPPRGEHKLVNSRANFIGLALDHARDTIRVTNAMLGDAPQ